jgi:DME family drug/metabolite transporter
MIRESQRKNTMSDRPPITLSHGRWCILIASVLWSLSGAFTKVLTQPTMLGFYPPEIETWEAGGRHFPLQIACWRSLFAGLVLVPMLKRSEIRVRPLMFAMAICFAVMTATFITAQALGTAANAILLQYSGAFWMWLASVFLLGEPADRRGTISLLIGMTGIGIIIAGGWEQGELLVIGIALLSGLMYGIVVVSLRTLRDISSNWLTIWNQIFSSLILLPLVLTLRPPTITQFAVLAVFGAVQMGLPYWLMARGLRVVNPQEAGTLTLVEPLLNPVWAYLIAGEVPHSWTFVGGAVILFALVWRYGFPSRSARSIDGP